MTELIKRMFIPSGLRSDATRAARMLTLLSYYYMALVVARWEFKSLFYEETGAMPSGLKELWLFFTDEVRWAVLYYDPTLHHINSMLHPEAREIMLKKDEAFMERVEELEFEDLVEERPHVVSDKPQEDEL